MPEESNTSILIGCLVTIILLLVVIIFLILWCQYVCKVLEKVGVGEVKLGSRCYISRCVVLLPVLN